MVASRGSFGAVFKGESPEGRPCAVKAGKSQSRNMWHVRSVRYMRSVTYVQCLLPQVPGCVGQGHDRHVVAGRYGPHDTPGSVLCFTRQCGQGVRLAVSAVRERLALEGVLHTGPELVYAHSLVVARCDGPRVSSQQEVPAPVRRKQEETTHVRKAIMLRTYGAVLWGSYARGAGQWHGSKC